MPKSRQQTILDRVPSNLAEQYREQFDKEFADHIAHENFRTHVISIMEECTNTVPFMRKIKEYAGEEIDTRIYKSVGFWTKTILIPILVAVGTVIILKLLKI